ERHTPAFLGHGTDLARQPVVTVHEVVPARGVRRFFAQHLEGELAELTRQSCLVQVFERTSHDVLNKHSWREFDDGGLIASRGPGEDVHLNSALGEQLGHFDDVHVQTAGVTGARLFERRCVDAYGRDSLRVATRHWHTPPRWTNP